jgi:TonB family protein
MSAILTVTEMRVPRNLVHNRLAVRRVPLLVLLVATVARAQGLPGGGAAPPAPTPAPPPAPPPTLDKPPKLLRFIAAAPPPSLAERRQVDVILTIDVDAAGRVTNVAVATSGGDEFDAAAVAAAQKFEFTPGEAGGQPVPVRITYKYRFVYRPPPPPPPPTRATATAVPTVPLDGTVREKGERVPIAGVTIAVGDQECVSAADGSFHFAALPVGTHPVKLRAPDIVATDLQLTLKAGTRLEVTWFVPHRERYSSTVRGQRVVQETVEHTLSGEELRHIPGTQGDTLKAVQTLPGVARAPFGGGQIVVWGTQPSSTRSYVDGVFIPTLYHFGGLRSTVNGEMVQELTFIPGGFGVDYGRGYGGVVEIETRKPKDAGVHGFAQLDLIDVSLMLDAKLTKTLSVTAAVRRSTIDAWLPYVTPNSFQATPTYYDYQLKLHWKPTSVDDLEIFVFGSDDAIHVALRMPDPALSASLDSHTFYHRFLARYEHRFGASRLTVTPWVGYDEPFAASGNFGNNPLTFGVTSVAYGLRAVARMPLTSWLRVDAGIDFEGSRWNLAGSAPFAGATGGGGATGAGGGGSVGGGNGVISENTDIYENDTAAYVALLFALLHKRLTITPGFRLDVYTATGYRGTPDQFVNAHANPEPRLAIRYQINRWAAIKAATGVYYEPVQPFQLVRAVGNPALLPSVGWHYVLGADFDPTRTLHVEIEGFYKDTRNGAVPGQHYGSPILVDEGIGRVYGAELMVRQELWHNFFGWISYTLSRSERRDHGGEPWHLFQYDQTHILTVIGSYKLPRGYQVGLRFRYVTGNPLTPVQQSYFNANSGSYVAIAGPYFSQRLAPFNQLDIRFDKTWTFDRWRLTLYLDIQNVYNYRSEESRQYNFDFTQSAPVTGLPFVPDLGIRGDF